MAQDEGVRLWESRQRNGLLWLARSRTGSLGSGNMLGCASPGANRANCPFGPVSG